jgi:hypothetical protein
MGRLLQGVLHFRLVVFGMAAGLLGVGIVALLVAE